MLKPLDPGRKAKMFSIRKSRGILPTQSPQTGISRRRTALVVCVVAVVAALTAGCSSGSEDSGTGSSGNSSVQEEAAIRAEAASKNPETYPGPSESFDPGTGRVGVMACGFAAPVCGTHARNAVAAFEAMGWDAGEAFDGELSPQKQAAFVDRAVQQKLDGIVLISVDVNTIKSSIDKAIAANLRIVCTMCAQNPAYEGKIYDATVDWKNQGEIMASAVLARSGSDAKVVGFADKAFESTVLRLQGLKAGIESNCPDCEFSSEEFASASISKPGPPEFTALLAANPPGTITDVVAHYDDLGIIEAKTSGQTGRDDITVWGYDGSETAVTALETGDPPYGGSVAEPYTYASWASADLIARLKAGAPIWEGYNSLPSVLITQDNAAQYLNPYTDPVPSGDWRARFLRTWGRA